MKEDIIIIGAGASGMCAAIAAAREGANVLLIDRMPIAGKKIMSTGNGRCNYTNRVMDAACFYSDGSSDLVTTLLKRCGTDDVIYFFKNLGIEPKERDGYFYPASMQAQVMVHVLKDELRHLGVRLVNDEQVTGIVSTEQGFWVRTDRHSYSCSCVILAAGGKASPKLGSDGSGYTMAKALGHKVIDPVPALCALKCKGRFFKSVAGVRSYGAISIYIEDKKKTMKPLKQFKISDSFTRPSTHVDGEPAALAEGELQWTAYGISGIPTFQVSRFAAKALKQGQRVEAEIDLLPRYDDDAAFQMLKERRDRLSYKTAYGYMEGLLNDKLISLILKASAIDEDCPVKSLDEASIEKLVQRMKHFRMEVTGTNGFESAQVTAGGVDTREIDADTFASKVCNGLYLAGEIIDVDGICGGYNLHFAWASGLTAGKAAAEYVKK